MNGELKDLLANYKVDHNPEALENNKMAKIANKFSFIKGLLWYQKVPVLGASLVTGVSCYFGGWWGLFALPPSAIVIAKVNNYFRQGGLKPGSQAPDGTVVKLDGSTVNLLSYQ